MTASRGAFIVLEGCDRSGKSTQCQRLVDYLIAKGRKVKLVKFPDRTTTIGKAINSYLKSEADLEDHVIHLLFSANRWELIRDIEKDLEDEVTIIADRYAFSGVAFSAAKGLDLEWCKSCDRGLLKPDATLFLDLSPEEMKKRGGFGDERYETVELQQKVRTLFHQLKGKDWKVLDAERDMDLISHDIARIAEDVISDSSSKALERNLFQ